MHLLIVGGGAAGITAAIAAARELKSQGKVTILERLDRIGKKILATGNGRCNFTNVYSSVENFHGKNPDFVNYAIGYMPPFAVIDFFGELGIIHKEEDNGKVYPYSLQASAISDVLRREIKRLEVEIVTDCTVKTVSKNGKSFVAATNKRNFVADKIILTCGGCSSPKLGSNGSGFKLLKDMGHTITKLYPALVQLKTSSPEVKGLDGIKVNAKASLKNNGIVIREDVGEILFRDYGLSGPPIFQISCKLEEGEKYEVSLDLMPEKNKKELFDILSARRKLLSQYPMEEFFTGMLNKKVGFAAAKRAGIKKLSVKTNTLSDSELSELVKTIKNFAFDVSGTKGFENAQVTAGGVLTEQFDPETMQSKKIKGLYCAGEIFDIYGDCGGHNLQWAWASGHLAGYSAALSVKNETKVRK